MKTEFFSGHKNFTPAEFLLSSRTCPKLLYEKCFFGSRIVTVLNNRGKCVKFFNVLL